MQPSESRLSIRRDLIRQLAVARMYSGISQEEMALRLGTKKPNISRLESGEQNITLDTFIGYTEAMGKVLNLTISEPAEAPDDSAEYCLRLYDEELIRFYFRRRGLHVYAEITDINAENHELLPMGLSASENGIIEWLSERVLPGSREFAADILRCLGLEISNLKGIVDTSKCLSLTDSYWVAPVDFTESFYDINLFDSYFDGALTTAAYTGSSKPSKRFTVSPELTTNGQLRKAWRRYGEGDIILYKGGSEGFANTGTEPFSEYYASQIARQMNLHAVRYELENWKGILSSKCKLFTDIDTSFVPASDLIQSEDIRSCLEYYRDLGEDFYDELCSMLIFDAVIYNESRHFTDFGLLRDNRSGNLISPAPIFDNGVSLFCYAKRSDFDNLEEYAKARSTPYGMSYDDILGIALGRNQKAQLRRLLGFKFKRSDTIDLPEWRIAAIEEQVQKRINYILSL